MLNNGDEAGEGGYRSYLIPLVIVLFSWGIVPGFAKLGGLPGDVTTFWVNWIALLAVAVFITLQGKWGLVQQHSAQALGLMALIGIAWPLIYSVAYFQAVQEGGPALTTILNYTWPVFCLGFSYWLNHRQVSRWSTASVILAAGAVAITYLLESRAGMQIAGVALLLGLHLWLSNQYQDHIQI